MKRYSMDRQGWYTYYVAQFNKYGKEAAAFMATWYLLLMHMDGEIE